MEPSREVSLLLKELRERSVFLRQRAAKELGRVDPALVPQHPELSTALRQALHDPNKYVQIAAASTLVRLEPASPLGLEKLQSLLTDDHRDVRANAAVALGDLGPAAQAAVAALQAALQDSHAMVRTRIEEALQKIQEAP